MIKFETHSYRETENFAFDFAKQIKGGAVIAFTGGMGMGKTAFTRGFVRGMGNQSDVYSPTFAIVNDYGGSPHIYHFDMYRIDTWDALYSTGFFDYITDESVLLIEWSENIENALRDDTVFVNIEAGDSDNDRVITVCNGKEEQDEYFGN